MTRLAGESWKRCVLRTVVSFEPASTARVSCSTLALNLRTAARSSGLGHSPTAYFAAPYMFDLLNTKLAAGAIFHVTGKRIRTLPVTADTLRRERGVIDHEAIFDVA